MIVKDFSFHTTLFEVYAASFTFMGTITKGGLWFCEALFHIHIDTIVSVPSSLQGMIVVCIKISHLQVLNLAQSHSLG